ncbi:MAG: hypothetical protein WC378_14015 [Opitutaceae bacterium]|jgi:hypothetical protein
MSPAGYVGAQKPWCKLRQLNKPAVQAVERRGNAYVAIPQLAQISYGSIGLQIAIFTFDSINCDFPIIDDPALPK